MTRKVGSLSGGASRRDFLRIGAMGVVAGATGITATTASGLNLPLQDDGKGNPSTAASMIGVPYSRITSPEGPRIGLIGVGGRGTSLLEDLLGASASVLAICDVVEEKATHAQSLVEKAGQKTPTLYTQGDHAFESLVARDDLDLVIIATPWNWHVEMAVAGMNHGKHVAVEVPAATTIEDCWKLVDTS